MAQSPTKASKKPFTLTQAHHNILVELHKYQLLTNMQLLVVCGYSKTSLERMQRLTKQLVDNEYLLASAVPTQQARSPRYFTLARKSLNYLHEAGFDVREYFRPSKEQERGFLFLNHTLALNDVLISAAKLGDFDPDYSLHSFIHERVLKQSPYKVAITSSSAKEETITLIPDAFLDFRQKKQNGKEERIPVIYEQDMGTIEQKNFRKKIRAYIHLIKSGAYTDLFQIKAAPTIAFGTTKGDKRREQMRDWTRKEAATTNEPGWLTDLFFFTALPESIDPEQLWLDPCWYKPFDEVKDTPQAVSLLEE